MSKNLGSMFGHRSETERKPDPSLPIPLAKIGIEVEAEKCLKIPSNLQFWEDKEDTSLRNHGREFVTMGPIYGLDISKALKELFDAAKKHEWSEGYPRAGIHIHLDVRDLDFEEKELARFASNYMIVEHALFAYCGEWRRQTGYTDALEDSQADFTNLGKFLFSPPTVKQELVLQAEALSKYQALNFKPLINFGTLEFRALPTTFDFDRVFGWIKLILALKRSAQDVSINEPLKILSKLGPLDYAERILGETFPLVSKFIDPQRVWRAVDNATALMAFGNQFDDAKKEPMGWDAPATKPNPILEKMSAKKSKAAAARKSKKAAPQDTTLNQLREQFGLQPQRRLQPLPEIFRRNRPVRQGG